jgi:hypothetical protein
LALLWVSYSDAVTRLSLSVIGIGLLTALAGAIEINLVVTGDYTVLSIGKITTEVTITIAGFILLCSFLNLSRSDHHRSSVALSNQRSFLSLNVLWEFGLVAT